MLAAGVAGTWLSWRYFVDTVAGQRLDESAFAGSKIGRNTLWRAAEPVLEIVSIPFVVIVLVAAAVIAFARRRWFLALQVTVLVGGANLTTQVLKRVVFDRPDLASEITAPGNSLPSGHTTVAASVAAALLLVVPRSARPVVAVLGGGYAAVTGVSTMVGGWHRPSDVIAAFAVVLAWAGLTTMLTAVSSPERAPADGSGAAATKVVATLLMFGAVVAGGFAVSALLRTQDRLDTVGALTGRSDLATAYVGSAFGVVAAAAALFAAVLVAHQIAAGARLSATSGIRQVQPAR